MGDVDLFQMALGLESPWYVDRTEFDVDAKRLDLYLDFRQSGRFTCPECGKEDCAAHDSTEKTWRQRCRWARDTGFEPMARCARSVEAHRRGILRWFRT